MTLPFTKMQAAGNDFMIVVGRSLPLPPGERIRTLADRRRGIGFDQLLWVEEPRENSGRRFITASSTPTAEKRVNAVTAPLCIAALVAEQRPAGEEVRLTCPGGTVRALAGNGNSVRCSLGRPQWLPERVPFHAGEEERSYALVVDGEPWDVEVLSLGNPHAVITVDDVGAAPVAELGSRLSVHERFPRGCNVGFAQTTGERGLKLRVYERGVGETPACGTGACAAAAAGIRYGRVRSPVDVEMSGGELRVEWAGDNEPVWLTGTIDHVFEGRVRL